MDTGHTPWRAGRLSPLVAAFCTHAVPPLCARCRPSLQRDLGGGARALARLSAPRHQIQVVHGFLLSRTLGSARCSFGGRALGTPGAPALRPPPAAGEVDAAAVLVDRHPGLPPPGRCPTRRGFGARASRKRPEKEQAKAHLSLPELFHSASAEASFSLRQDLDSIHSFFKLSITLLIRVSNSPPKRRRRPVGRPR
jgi:hypothetical protein